MVKEWYVIKSVTEKKDLSWNVFAITIVYYHEKNENFTTSQTFTVADFKKLYWDLNLKTLPWKSVSIKEELIIK